MEQKEYLDFSDPMMKLEMADIAPPDISDLTNNILVMSTNLSNRDFNGYKSISFIDIKEYCDTYNLLLAVTESLVYYSANSYNNNVVSVKISQQKEKTG